MYCDRCGNQLTSGGQYCTKCGKAVVGAATFSAAGPGFDQMAGRQTAGGQTVGEQAWAYRAGSYAAGRPDGRVQRHVRTLATLWAVNGALRLMEVCWMMVFGTMFLPFMRGWMGGAWPFDGRWGLGIPFLGGLVSVAIFLGFFGVAHLLLAWGLFEREPWARVLGLVIGFLALLRFPLGTVLGIYTLWVLLPEGAGAEYDRLAQSRGRVNSAAVSS